MRLLRCLLLIGLMALGQGGAFAQGRPEANRPPAEADAHPHAHHAEAPAVGADVPALPAPPRWQGREWTKYPLIVPAMRAGQRDRGALAVALKNIAPAAMDVFAPDLASPQARRQVPLEADGTPIAMLPRVGNFYWLSARQEDGGRVSVASTVTYFSEPGPAPTQLLLVPKSELELIPQPLPREHGSYRESEKWKFLLRFNGKPLAGTTVRMETELGTKTAFVSDGEGAVTVLFPRDFKTAEAGGESGHHGPRAAKFVLAAEHEADGRTYLTAFNYTYSPDADRDRSLAWGAAFGVLGMVAAAPLLRRRATRNEQGEANA